MNKIIDYLKNMGTDLSSIEYIEVFSIFYRGKYMFNYLNIIKESEQPENINWLSILSFYETNTELNIFYVK